MKVIVGAARHVELRAVRASYQTAKRSWNHYALSLDGDARGRDVMYEDVLVGILRLHIAVRISQFVESAGEDEQRLAVQTHGRGLRAIDGTVRIIRQVDRERLK
jgi:hypothetical protein